MKARNSMKIERLHTFTTQDWTQISKQFEGLYAATFNFVTENKGSVAEAKSVYVEAFLYYTQMIELHGMNMLEQGSDIVYSFARCIWIKKLRKRNVDVNFVKHRREFFEMEDAFHEIDAISERSTKTGDKLAGIGEPARTLVLEYIGNGQNIDEIAQRLGYADTARAKSQVGKSIQKLIKEVEGKDLNIDAEAFAQTLNVVLTSSDPHTEASEVDKLSLAMVSRTVAMIKNYVNRNKRLELFKDMEVHFEAKVIPMNEDKPVASNPKKMKPVAMIAATILVAIVVSALTAFGLAEIRDTEKQITQVEVVPTPVKEEPVEVIEETIPINFTAFAINKDGYLLTTADAVEGKSSVRLQGNGANRNTRAEVVSVNSKLNVALIKCQFEKGTRIDHRLSPDNPELGQSLFSLGYPENELFYDKLEVNASTGENIGRSQLDQYAPGSPVISEKGQIVGVITGMDTENGMADLAYVGALREFLAEAKMPEGESVQIPSRNGLYYKNRVEQIDALTPFLWKIN